MVRTRIIYKTVIGFSILVGSCEQKEINASSTETSAMHDTTDHNHETLESYYTCSMHPKIKSDKPGKCPICYMNLTKVEVDTSEAKEKPDAMESHTVEDIQGIIGKIKLRKSQLKHFNPEYFPVSPMKMVHHIRLLGSITQSEQKESNIPARISGRVEKVFIKSTGSLIKKGDPVLKYYSPKLITAGEEYILARKAVQKSSSPEFQALLKTSEERLRLWGVNERQYKSWYKKDEVPREITIYASTSGVVRKMNATRGKYFKEGQNFFELSDLSTVWVEMDVYEHDSSLVKIGQEVSLRLTAIPGQTVSGLIDFINPVLNPKSRTLKIRTSIRNEQGKLMPGMVADATLIVDYPGHPLVVPRSAVIDTGIRKVVWTKQDDKRFQAQVITTGLESQGYVEVLSGLHEGQMVVTEGNFLLDAQAQLFGGYENFDKSNH